MYTWGDGRNGQLGVTVESFNIQPTPLLVDSLVTGGVYVSQIACGRSHTLALSGTDCPVTTPISVHLGRSF